jgi:hypothetical protein
VGVIMRVYCHAGDTEHLDDHRHSCWLLASHDGAHICYCYWVWMGK